MGKKTIIIHIPHSKTTFPKNFNKSCLLTKDELEYYVDKMTDNKLLEFFGRNSNKFERNKKYNLYKYKDNVYLYFPSYSRLFIDMERYCDDSQELMAKYGQGVVYLKTFDNKDLINYNEKYKKKLVKQYYIKYHNRLNKFILKKAKTSELVIIDLHSFGRDQVKHYPTFIQDKELPDFNLGFNTHKTLTYGYIKNEIESQGYSVLDNYPYSGTYIPQDIGNISIESVMIELNKDIYLQNDDDYKKTKKLLMKIIDRILK